MAKEKIKIGFIGCGRAAQAVHLPYFAASEQCEVTTLVEKRTELASILEASGWDGTITPLLRKRVARHVDRCDICRETERRVGAPFALYASIPAATAIPGLRERVVAAASSIASGLSSVRGSSP